MKIVSNLMFSLGRVIGLTEPDQGGNNVLIPSVFSPTLELRHPLDAPNITGSADVQENTCHTSTFLTVNGASGAQSASLMTLSKGLWEFNVWGSCNSDFKSAVLFKHWIELIFGGGTVYLMGFNSAGAAAAPTAQCGGRVVRLLIPVQFIIRAQASNNGAGENMNSAWDILATKLI